MNEKHRDQEFYVGYLDPAPQGIARVVKRTVAGLYVAAAVLAVVLILSHGPFDPARFDFLQTESLQGVMRASPYPTLEVERPAGDGSRSQYLLVDRGKFGADSLAAPLDGKRVELQGSLIYRQGQTMVEVLPESVQALMNGAPAPAPLPVEDLGSHTLVGEIVDSKCFLGVMNPGRLKTHKACAIRCIAGGIPPMLHVRSEDRGAVQFLLVSETGEAVNSQVLDFVAEPIEITGRVTKHGDRLLLWSDPATFKRVR